MESHGNGLRVRVYHADPQVQKRAREVLERAGFDVVEGSEFSELTSVQIERRVLEERLRRHGGNRAATARSLGLCEKTIYNKSKLYGIQRGRGQS